MVQRTLRNVERDISILGYYLVLVQITKREKESNFSLQSEQKLKAFDT